MSSVRVWYDRRVKGIIPYIRLLRLQDQYIQFGAAIAAGLYTGEKAWWIFWWAIAATLISFAAFIANELTDGNDVDRYSWNPLHGAAKEINHVLAWGIAGVSGLAGLLLAAYVSLFWWAAAMLVVGLAYSLEPLRLKRRLLLDGLGQLVVWWVIPFSAPIVRLAAEGIVTIGVRDILFALTMVFLQWGLFLPYQLSDFEADRKAGFKNTHVVLGMEKSLMLGRFLVIVGVGLYIVLGYALRFTWSLPFAIASLWIISLYGRWLRLGSVSQQSAAMQHYVRTLKPVSQAMALVYLVWWRGMGISL